MAHVSSHNKNIIRWNLWNHQSYVNSQINTFAFYVFKVYNNDEKQLRWWRAVSEPLRVIFTLRIFESLQQKDSYLFLWVHYMGH